MQPADSIAQICSMLEWQWHMGADEAIDEEAGQWLVADEKPAPALVSATAALQSLPPLHMPPREMPSSATPNHTQSAAALAAEAAQLAMKAANLAELREAILSFDGCALKRSARQTVVHDGNPEGDILIIGEAPGAEEDKQGIPFCGASGQLLDQMLASINLSRSAQCLITNTVYWRPPGNRTPTVEELDICAPFVARHIGLFQPKLILLMGATAAKAVLNEQRSLSRLRNQPLSYACAQTNRDIPVRVLFHPSYLLRQPLHKKLAWQDLLAIEAMVKNN